MTCWNEIMAKAVSAKEVLVRDLASGQAAFSHLIHDFPESGMVHFQQGQGYEAMGDIPQAFTSYSKAENLFRVPEWRARARTARIRCSRPPDPEL
jgi:hypothetical protein